MWLLVSVIVLFVTGRPAWAWSVAKEKHCCPALISTQLSK